jgi:type IV pilus assembly protein PilW
MTLCPGRPAPPRPSAPSRCLGAGRVRPREQGVGLVDLLVGLAIGLLVSLAALGSLTQSRLLASAVDESTRMQLDAATALRILGHQLTQAGAPVLVDTAGGTVRIQRENADNPGGWISGTDGSGHSADTLSVAYLVDATADARDCLGQSPAGAVVRSSFRPVGQELQCLGSAARPTYQGIAVGVEDFQVWYGVREDSTLQYRTANAVTHWSMVTTVQVCLVMVGEKRTHPGTAAPAPGCRAGTLKPQDGRLRRVFRQVFALRHSGLAP